MDGDIFEPSLRTCLVSPSAVMMGADLFRYVGGFDEQFEACEDYDLWLRILCRHRAGLLDEPLVTRRAGHPDQLSATIPALDRYRIRALLKLLAGGELNAGRRRAVAEVLAEKCAIFAKGHLRRGRRDASDFYSSAGQAAQEIVESRSEIATGYWIAALESQPLNLEHE
jgi:hypothetical protein